MVTQQEISFQLKQPVKDIADWSFPLSEILEMYLQEQSRINFSEAAIVVQNSTSAYIFRLENLYNKITVLQQPLLEKEQGKTSRHYGKKGLSEYNFENFHLVDMEKRLGRNIDVKDESEVKETIKLISRRFPELEDFDVNQSHPPIYFYDVCGDVIGKKYDFRCNHPMDLNGTLVDELTPDAPDIFGSPVKERRNSTLQTPEFCTPGTATSGYVSGACMSESHTTNDDSPKDLDADIANLDHVEDLSDENAAEPLEDTTEAPNTDGSPEQQVEVVNADKEKVMTPRKRSERLRNLQLGTISQLIDNAWKVRNASSKPSSPVKVRKAVTALRNAAKRTRKRKHSDNRREANNCAQSTEEALEDNRLNLSDLKNNEDNELENNLSDISRSPSPLRSESRGNTGSPDSCAKWGLSDSSYTVPDYLTRIEDKLNEIANDCDVKTEWEEAIAEWHRILQPKLVEAENRAAFDLLEYKSDIISSLNAAEDKKCDFDDVTRGKASYEVSRYFLASLHLANTRNIEISKDKEVGMHMTLLNEVTK